VVKTSSASCAPTALIPLAVTIAASAPSSWATVEQNIVYPFAGTGFALKEQAAELNKKQQWHMHVTNLPDTIPCQTS